MLYIDIGIICVYKVHTILVCFGKCNMSIYIKINSYYKNGFGRCRQKYYVPYDNFTNKFNIPNYFNKNIIRALKIA